MSTPLSQRQARSQVVHGDLESSSVFCAQVNGGLVELRTSLVPTPYRPPNALIAVVGGDFGGGGGGGDPKP